MKARAWPLFVLFILGACQPACVFLALGEKQIPECSGISYDNFNGKRYELVRILGQNQLRRQIEFNITKGCDVDYRQDLTALGVESIEIRDSRSASGAIVVIKTTYEDKSSETVSCTAPLVEFDKLEFICPERCDLSFVMAPLE